MTAPTIIENPPSVLQPAYVFTVPAELTTTDNALIPWLIGRGTPIDRLRASVKTAPTGASVVVAFRRYDLATGALIDTIGSVSIAAGAFTGTTDLGAAVTILETQALAAEITQIGSTLPGENLSLMADMAA